MRKNVESVGQTQDAPASRRTSIAITLSACLFLASCGGSQEPMTEPGPDAMAFADGLLARSSTSRYTPLLALEGSWRRCDGAGVLDMVTVKVVDPTEGTVQLEEMRTAYYADNDCTGSPVAQVQQINSTTGGTLEILVAYTDTTFMSRDYLLPPSNERADTTFLRVRYTAPPQRLEITGTAGVTPRKNLSGQAEKCFNRTPTQEICLPDTETAAQLGNAWRAVRLETALTPDALYLFKLLPKVPPAVLENWYYRSTPAG